MNKTYKKVLDAFLQRESLTICNDSSDGKYLAYHGHVIAEWRESQLVISNASWFTASTRSRLNMIPGISIHQRNFKWYLNGELWNGDLDFIPIGTPLAKS